MNDVPRPHRDLFRHDPEIGHLFVPGVRIRVPHESGGYLVATNGDGFRCRHEVTRTRSSRYRVLVFGDSFTAGEGVSNGKRFSDVLENELPETEVLNFGLPASGTDQQFLLYNRYRHIEHDLVVLALFTENIRRNPCQCRLATGRDGKQYYAPKPWFELGDHDNLVLRGEPVPDEVYPAPVGRAWGNRVQRARWFFDRISPDVKDLIQRFTRHQPSPEYGSAESKEWKLLRAILMEWKARSSVPFVVMLVPWYMYIEKTASFSCIDRRFRELAEESGISILNPLDVLSAADRQTRRRYRFRRDNHYTVAAHRVVGSFLAEKLLPFLPHVP